MQESSKPETLKPKLLKRDSNLVYAQVLLINMRKEVAPFLPSPVQRQKVGEADQCSTILLNSESLAVIAHNEDADISLLNHA